MYSFRIPSSPRIYHEAAEKPKTAIDNNVPKVEGPPYVPGKISPDVRANEAQEKKSLDGSLEGQMNLVYPDYSKGNIKENNEASFISIQNFLSKVPESPAKEIAKQRVEDIQKLFDTNKLVRGSIDETNYIRELISYINKELVAEKQSVMLEKGKELGEKVQEVQKTEDNFAEQNREYRKVHENLEEKLALWSNQKQNPDLQKLATTIAPFLENLDYTAIEKALALYKAEQKQKNQLPEAEKQEKEGKILLQMREFYKGSQFATGDIGVDPAKMSFKDFTERVDIMSIFRKDPLGQDFLAYEMIGQSSDNGGEVDGLIIAIGNARFAAQNARDAAQHLMDANSEKNRALTQYNAAIKDYETVVVQTQKFESSVTKAALVQNYPNYKILTSSDIPGTSASIYAEAFAVNKDIKVSSLSYAVDISRSIPPGASVSIGSNNGSYYQVSRNENGSLYFVLPRTGVSYNISHPENDIVFYATLGETPIIRDMFALGQDKFRKIVKVITRKHEMQEKSGDIDNPDVLMNTIVQSMGVILGDVAKDMPPKFQDGKTASQGISQYFTPERQKTWRMAMKDKGLMREDNGLNYLGLLSALENTKDTPTIKV